ncbi:hypothetical protein SAMN04487965_1696 [Microbulbifer donghaiensis]|uniref:O-antigen ligase like membrane protein n=1 Tax=Microbulbifer donghaiensis TaxID=494016 RepID=A0A1M4ZZ62_9GAMM|nr:hypothetical protein [Microbulbifer donghaiensis]SHF23288.1 hypothetical protein SAMN04487965_1696 [Microbulbifer donghaiensis]
MPNTFAYIALISWPLVAIVIYRMSRMSTLTATFWVLVGGYLLLPVRTKIDLPLIPPLDQITIPAISAAVCCILIRKVRIKLLPDGTIMRCLFICLMLAPLLSAITNPEPMFDGLRQKPGLTYYDAIADTVGNYLKILPLLLGITLVRNTQDIVKLLKLLIYAGIAYSPLMLLEIRISPQLHTWVYGFFPHQFTQQIRFDGFRPVVFLGHGLLVATFIAMVLCATATLWRRKYRISGLPIGLLVIYFAVILVLCKAVSAWLLGFGAMLCILFLPPKVQMRASIIVTLFIVVYPLLAINGLIPYQKLIELSTIFGSERAHSLAFRFTQESELLEHAAKKIAFGWGMWGRHQLSNSISDGHLIGVLGTYGIWGYLTETGLLLSAFIYTVRTAQRSRDRRAIGVIAGTMSILMLVMIDQIPNSSLTPCFWLLLGGVLGVTSRMHRQALRQRQRIRLQSINDLVFIGNRRVFAPVNRVHVESLNAGRS